MRARTRVAAAFLAVAAAAVGLAGATGAQTQQATSRPNVVVVMTDDQTVESLRVMTNVQRLLAGQGTSFANSFASYPLCCPSRATFITGQYAHNHAVMGNRPPMGGYEKLAPTHGNTLPGWLQRAGYHTIHIGKYLNGYGRADPSKVPPGWTEWYGSVDPTTYSFYGYTLNENGTLIRYGHRPDEYQADVFTRKAVTAVRRLARSQKPFFLSLAYLAPHSGAPRETDDPWNLPTPVPAPRHRNRFESEPVPRPPSFNEADVSDKAYYVRRLRLMDAESIAGVTEMYRQRLESLLAVDEGVAQLVQALRASGELDRTLIVFTSDNGYFHGEHRFREGKVQAYEPSIRVPLILRGPGIPRGARRTQDAINVDLVPTILEAAGGSAGRVLDGTSLLPLARDPQLFPARDVLLETNIYGAIRTPRYVYVKFGSEHELYDLVLDPHQLRSRHADKSLEPIRTELARRLAFLRKCEGAACRAAPRVVLAVRCAKGHHVASVRGPDTRWVKRAGFGFRGRPIASDRRRPFRVPVRSGRSGTVRATVTLVDGRVVAVERNARACR